MDVPKTEAERLAGLLTLYKDADQDHKSRYTFSMFNHKSDLFILRSKRRQAIYQHININIQKENNKRRHQHHRKLNRVHTIVII